MSRHTTKKSPRCQHRTPTGRQCRGRTSGAASRLCPRHASAENDSSRHLADLTAALALGEQHENAFRSAEGLNRSFANLYTLLAEDRVSPRRAAVLAYIGSLLLRTLPAMEKESAPKDPKNRPVKIIWDIPRPAREQTQPTS